VGELLQQQPKNIWALQYGELEHLCVALVLQGNDGKTYHNKLVPRTAAGPDFRSILLGFVGKKGRLNNATLRVHPLPEHVAWHCSYWSEPREAQRFLQHVLSRHFPLSFARVYEEEELPKVLQRAGESLVSFRCSGLETWVKSAEQRLSEFVREQGGYVMRISKTKTIPALESLLKRNGS